MTDEVRPPACPICHADLNVYEFLKLAASVFTAMGVREKCPRCKTVFYLESEEAVHTIEVIDNFTGKRRPLVEKTCRCGCGWKFKTRFENKKYFNNRHRQHAYDAKKILTARAIRK